MIELKPIRESISDWDAAEARIKSAFKREIYYPLLKLLNEPYKKLKNSKRGDYDALIDALYKGRVTFNMGVFSGRFNADITKNLRALGASFDRRLSVYRISSAKLPREVQNVISSSSSQFEQKIRRLDEHLAAVSPDALAGKIKFEDVFDRVIWKTETEFQKSVKGITIAPKLTREQSKRIADEWQTNMKLYIKDWTEKEIVELRTKMRETVFEGNRYGSAIEMIQRSYGVSANKAKFLARQETSLLMTKFKQTRYEDAGVNEYLWYHVEGTGAHPVRPQHRKLGDAKNPDGTKKIYRWDDPPVTTGPGEASRRNNPGQDYNCRCFAKPVVRFKPQQ